MHKGDKVNRETILYVDLENGHVGARVKCFVCLDEGTSEIAPQLAPLADSLEAGNRWITDQDAVESFLEFLHARLEDEANQARIAGRKPDRRGALLHAWARLRDESARRAQAAVDARAKAEAERKVGAAKTEGASK